MTCGITTCGQCEGGQPIARREEIEEIYQMYKEHPLMKDSWPRGTLGLSKRP